jgi:hypothetical protein
MYEEALAFESVAEPECSHIQVSIETLPPTCVPREQASLSHRLGFARHYYDETRRRNVTDGRIQSHIGWVSLVTTMTKRDEGM